LSYGAEVAEAMEDVVVSFQIDRRQADLTQSEQFKVRQGVNIQSVQAVQLRVAVTDVLAETAIRVLLLVQVFQQLVHQVVVEVKHVALLMHTLVTHHLYGSVAQVIGDFHKLQEVQREVSIVITKCGTL
tara:strand:+ start:3228 stop:3614 length:387 start_codon:yes stop_codon:yes gene_type:complete